MLDKVQSDLKEAMLAADATRVSTLRMLVSELRNAQIAKGSELTDEDAVAVVQKEVKKRREAAVAFEQGGRTESADKEKAEAQILEAYLPAQMSEEELTAIVDEAITNSGSTTMADMGRVMGMVREKVGQAAEPSRISALVKSKLNG